MGYKINVDHSKFEKVAATIDQYNETTKKKLKQADDAVKTMTSSWQGPDAAAYQLRWDQIDSEDSTVKIMERSLTAYAEGLRLAASEYKKAQSDAVNRAGFLQTW